MHKRLLIFSISILLTVSACLFGAGRELLYQGKVSDAIGDPINQNSVSVIVKFYDASTGGSSLEGFSETHLVNIENGLFEISIGSKTTNGIPSSIFDTGDDVYLSISINSQEQLPRPKLAFVPYTINSYGSSINCEDYPDTVDAGTFCIDRDLTNVLYGGAYQPQVACAAKGMRLCYWMEYATACVLWQNGDITLYNMISNASEYVQHTASRAGSNNRGFGHETGGWDWAFDGITWYIGTCFDDLATIDISTITASTTFPYRCCIEKK